MKKIGHLLSIIGLMGCFAACNPIEIDFKDPQEVATIQDAILQNEDLVELFGEHNIHFGPVPPPFTDSICFIVDGMDYDTSIRYIFDIYNNNEPILSHAEPPTYDAAINTHLFHDHDQCLMQHKMETRDTYGNTYHVDIDTAYFIGHDSLFTTYYVGKTYGNGNPTIAMIISGTMVFETDPATQQQVFKGVRNYLFGKKILAYEYQPSQAYAPGTIEIKRHNKLCPACSWNSAQP